MIYTTLFKLAAPEIVVVVAALLVLAADLLTMRDMPLRMRFTIGSMIACAGCVGAIALLLISHEHSDFMSGMFVVNALTSLMKVGILALTIFTVLISLDGDFTVHVGEYLALVLLGASAMMFLVSAEDLLMIFVALEMTSLTLYILTAFNKRNVQSSEAALKYFLFGAMSAAFTLYGLSLLYGLTGSTNLAAVARGIAEKLGNGGANDPILVAALVMTVIGFGFKIAAVPFHLWAPDAYQGAPAPSAAFVASGSKVASFFVFSKVMIIGFAGVGGEMALHHFTAGWMPLLALVAVLSMVVGNVVAIVQTSVRRLLAYSAIAHGGYLLLGILAGGGQNQAALIYYVLTYGLTTVGAFGVVAIVEQLAGGDTLADFAGLSRRAPVLSFCMLIFVLSLAGIPPLAGFFGKFYIFANLVTGDLERLRLIWLVAVALAMSAVSLYYYLQVLKQVYVANPPPNSNSLKVPAASQISLCVIAALVVLLGCAPGLLLARVTEAIRLAGL